MQLTMEWTCPRQSPKMTTVARKNSRTGGIRCSAAASEIRVTGSIRRGLPDQAILTRHRRISIARFSGPQNFSNDRQLEDAFEFPL
jgi:hypothetical protein